MSRDLKSSLESSDSSVSVDDEEVFSISNWITSYLKFSTLYLMVEAAGVEPASETLVNKETPCVVAFV